MTSTDWWRDAVIYQVYPRSFADSDGDGIGDLPGVISRLPHVASLGVDAVWLSPFYVSPQRDGGYDVADYRDVDPVFGTLADADRLVERAHRLGLRVIVDLVPNHTSSDHPWFRAAVAAGPGSPERARYLFRPGRGAGGELPPNDWRSTFGGPAWTRLPDGEWYLHLFDRSQPDLDWTNPEVRAEFESVLGFWLDRGVDGFRVDVANGLVKEPGLRDWSEAHGLHEGSDVPGEGPPMWDRPEVHEIYREWRRVLDRYPHRPILVAEAWVRPPERQARYVRPDEMHQAFNFEYLLTPWEPTELRRIITDVLRENLAVGAAPTWVLSNHDVVRHATRLAYPPQATPRNGVGADDPQPDPVLGLRRGRAATLLMLALPGSGYLYQGEELGLPEHTTLPDEVRQDPTWARTGGAERGRDGCRVPIPWRSEAASYGFGPGRASWLPQPEEWARLSVDRQTGDATSTLELYRAAIRIRRERRLGLGTLRWDGELVRDPAVLAFRTSSTRVIANLGTGAVPLPPGSEVLLASGRLITVTPGVRAVPPDTTAWIDAPR